jgi:ribosomal protein L11 methyltransferase
VTTALWEAGTLGCEVRSLPDGPGLLAYFPAGTTAEDLDARLAGIAHARVEAVAVPEVDWVARFRESFKGFGAGGFWISPVWEQAKPGPDLIRIDPGRAFGTGTHETTRLCLGALRSLAADRGLGLVLDVGTGTGLLAIAAMRLGATAALAVDNDPECTAAARSHAKLNATPIRVVRGDGAAAFRPAAFDVVVANITAPLLAARCEEIGSKLAPSGALVLSGLLAEDVPAIRSAYGRLGPSRVLADGEWAALVIHRADSA